MGLDLTLMPLRGPRELGEEIVCPLDMLRFDRDYEIFRQITDFNEGNQKPTIIARPLPPQMWVQINEDDGLKRTRNDTYGTELTFVYNKELKKLKLPHNVSPKNKAIKAFIDTLPDDFPIILMWG